MNAGARLRMAAVATMVLAIDTGLAHGQMLEATTLL